MPRARADALPAPASPLALASPARAAAPVRPATLAELVERAKAGNPQAAAARLQAAAALAAVEPARAPENPTLSIVEQPIPSNPLAIGTSRGLTWYVQQPVPWPGKKRLAGEVAQAQADQARLQADQAIVQLVGQLKSAWQQYQLLGRQADVARETIARLGQVKAVAQVRYAQNAAAFVDYLNAQVAEHSARTDLFALERQRSTVAAQVNTLVGRDAGEPLEIEPDAPVDPAALPAIEELRAQALERNPALRAEQFAVAANERGLELARMGSKPDFVGYLYVTSNAPPWAALNVQSYGLQLDVRFPLWFSRKEKYLIDQAAAQLESERSNQQSLRQQMLLALESAYQAWAQGARQAAFVRDSVLAQARAAYRLAVTNYGVGQASFADVSAALLALKSAELALAQARAQVEQARAAVDAAVGLPD